MKTKNILLFFAIILNIGCVKNSGRMRFTEEDIATAKVNNASKIINSKDSVLTLDIKDNVCDDAFNTSNMIDTMFFVPLQTKNESIFASPIKIIVTEDRIFVMDTNLSIVIFDRNGNFVNSLKKGNGPGEINRIGAISYDDKSQELLVVQNMIINHFDKNGKKINKSEKLPFNTSEFVVTDYGYIFYQATFENQHLGDEAKYAVLITNKKFEIISKGIEVLPQNNVIHCGDMMFKNNGKCLVSQFMNDTIFEFDFTNPNICRAKYLLEYSNNKVENVNEINESSKFYNSACIIENSQTQVLKFDNRSKGMCCVVRDQNSGNSIGGTRIYFDKNILPNYLANTATIADDYFVSYITPYSNMRFSSPNISETDNQKIAELSEDDNIVIIFYKFKKW